MIDARTVRTAASVLGLIAGTVGFVGFFVDFFTRATTSLSSTSYGWFDLIPIFIGLSALGLLIPRVGYLASGLAFLPLGMMFGFRGLFSGEGRTSGYSYGFWMVMVGAGVLGLMWLVVLVTLRFWCSPSGGSPAFETIGQRAEGGDEQLAPEGSEPGRQPASAVTRTKALRKAVPLLGVVAGAVAFAGFFVGFFGDGSSALSNASSAWFDLIPVFIGLSVAGLLAPRIGYLVSGTALLALGIALGVRTFVSAVLVVRGETIGYGPGYWMIVIGSSILALLWLGVLATMPFWRAADHDRTIEDPGERAAEIPDEPLPVG